MDYGLVVHGGAWAIPDDEVDSHLEGVETACRIGNDLLSQGYSAIHTIEKIIRHLEDDPTFDAGRGSHLNDRKEVELDAIIGTDDYDFGAVSAIQNVKHPISVAKLIRDNTEHVMLTGKGAYHFAKQMQAETCDTADLLVGRELKRYKELQSDPSFTTKDAFKKQGFGTVGTVCMDQNGRFAIGVSTGGTPNKMAGRVGDTPLWGAGGFVKPVGGAAATGYGEDLIRILATQRTVNLMENGLSPQKAADNTIDDLENQVAGLGGIICMNKNSIGYSFNTPRMAWASQKANSKLESGINE